ncbi:hypothetical protein A0H81_09092 [Grifola frondosa]|uniref:Uncharacterized protein n=1 Tax=Grifola frondosa TaxID=5627 RepID=A0A1C7M2L0_GRIFR|nr:hypothetical protein A0H81_09092 [Grifola frondosa]
MFPKGPRFVATKSSDIPGPNTYNPQDPEYDAYKRGAFLEKTNRFNKDKPSDVPGPGAYNTDTNPTVPKVTNSTKSSSSDRYAVLQRKVEELERLHVEAKKAHHLELERLKSELSRAQKGAAEQTERADKLKKQNEAFDARVQELKKASSSEQSELRELRIKLCAAEHERIQLASKQNEGAEARKALQAAEERRREEVRERDRKIAELEKSLGAEKKRRETVNARLQDLRGQADGKAQEARAAMVDLEKHLQVTTAEAQEAKSALAVVEIQAQSRREIVRATRAAPLPLDSCGSRVWPVSIVHCASILSRSRQA